MKLEQVATELSKLVISSDKQEPQRKTVEQLGEEAYYVMEKWMKEQFRIRGIEMTRENVASFWKGFNDAGRRHLASQFGKENCD